MKRPHNLSTILSLSLLVVITMCHATAATTTTTTAAAAKASVRAESSPTLSFRAPTTTSSSSSEPAAFVGMERSVSGGFDGTATFASPFFRRGYAPGRDMRQRRKRHHRGVSKEGGEGGGGSSGALASLSSSKVSVSVSVAATATATTTKIWATAKSRELETEVVAPSPSSLPKILSLREADDSIAPLLNLASAHFTTQALLAIVRLGIPDIVGDSSRTVDEIIASIRCAKRRGGGGSSDRFTTINRDALLRSMRMLSSVGIFRESSIPVATATVTVYGERGEGQDSTNAKKDIDENDDNDNGCGKGSEKVMEEGKSNVTTIAFSLTSAGALLQTRADIIPDYQPSLACCIEHWAEDALWKSWAELPGYIAGTPPTSSSSLSPSSLSCSSDTKNDNGGKCTIPPFERANGGLSAADYYNDRRNPNSLRHQNDFVQFVSSREEPAILLGYDWQSLAGKTVVDVGGHHGAVLGAVKRKHPDVRCVSLDLPDVVEQATTAAATAKRGQPPGVELVGGDMFDPNTIPPCDAILLRHMLCNFDDGTATQILRNCYTALSPDGTIIIGDIILPDAGEDTSVGNGRTRIFVDALMMITGVRGERIQSQWAVLASNAGFRVDSVVYTSSPSCDVMVLKKV